MSKFPLTEIESLTTAALFLIFLNEFLAADAR